MKHQPPGRLWCLLLVGALGCTLRVEAQPSATAIVDRIRVNTSRAVDFHAAAFPETVYVGQQVTYQVAVLLSEGAKARLRRDPEFHPPELRGLLAYELGKPRTVPAREFSGRRYEAHVFQRALFGIAPGHVTIAAPELTYYLPQSSSYFSREERHVVRAESLGLIVRALPGDGRPSDFSGAVGALRIYADLDSAMARVGDPLVLTVRVEGTGNVKLFPRPTVEVPWASSVPGSERVQVDSSGTLVRGVKEFDFILTPTRPGAVHLPVLRYSYFDPYHAAYKWAESTPVDVRVAEGSLVDLSGIGEVTELPLRKWKGVETWASYDASVGQRLVLVGMWLGGLFVALGAWWVRRRKLSAADVSPVTARSLPAEPGARSRAETARFLRHTLLERLSKRLHVPVGELILRRNVERVLRRCGVTRESTCDILAVLDDLDVEGFAQESDRRAVAEEELENRVTRALRLVDREAVSSPSSRLWARRAAYPMLLSFIAPALAGFSARALAQQSVGAPGAADISVIVNEAAAAYGVHKYVLAAEQYGRAVQSRPNDVDLLMNWGTAAWAAGDTVSAAMAWQRAARLEPIAKDVQERLTLLPPGARSGVAEIPMVAVLPLIVTATVGWCLGIAIFLVAMSRDGAPDRGLFRVSVAAAVMLVSAGIGIIGWWSAGALDPTGLAVVQRPVLMRVQPANDANTMGGLATGDIVRIAVVQQSWARVEHGLGRFGWVPAERLTPLVGQENTR